MRTVIAILAMAAVIAAQDEAPDKRAEAAAAKVRKALEDVEGVRTVSTAGVDGVYRLIVSVESDEARAEVKKLLGNEFEGHQIVVYSPAARASIWSKPKETDAKETPGKADKPAAAVWPPKAEAKDDTADAAKALAELQDKEYDLGIEKVKMAELLDCDGVRAWFRIPAIKRAKGVTPCTLVLQLNFGFNLGAKSSHFMRHRDECVFSAPNLHTALPDDIRRDLERYARLAKKLAKK
jgi:hypothetical protein